jgi:subtilisin family serine protease
LHNFNPSHPLASPDPEMRTEIPILLDRGISYILFNWDQPSFSASQGISCQSDLDIYIYEEETNTLLDCSTSPYCSGGTDFNIGADAVEVLFIDVDAILTFLGRPNAKSKSFTLSITHFSGPYANLMQIIILGGDFTDSLKTNSGTSFGHPIAKGAAGVGAAYSKATPAYGVPTIELEEFSSTGGIPILFDTQGNRLQKTEIRNQPRFTGPDGVSTTFFYSKYPGFPNPLFFGTSASAPHVAAVAALMLQGNPSLSPDDIYGALQATAIDMNNNVFWTSKGFDFASGYGFVDAAAAVKYVAKKGEKSKKAKKEKKAKKARLSKTMS